MFRWLAPFRPRALRHGVPCVGLIVFLGCFSFLVVPDDNFAPNSQNLHKVLPAYGPPMVVIDPGHGGIDDGTKYYGLAEKDVTLDVAERLERILKSGRVDTVLTRRDDVYVPLPERVEIANRLGETNANVIFISLHFNQSPVESVDGIETYYADQKLPQTTDWTWVGFFNRPDDEHLDLGENSVVSKMLVTNRGIKSRSLFVVRHTRMPAVLVEGGFLSNKMENQLLRNDGYRDRLAQGLAAGIMAYIQTMPSPAPSHLATAY